MKSLPFASHAFPAIIAPVLADSVAHLEMVCARAAQTPGVDVLEWRVDHLLAAWEGADGEPGGEPAVLSSSACAALASRLADAYDVVGRAGIPVLTTLRTAGEGGAVRFQEEYGQGHTAATGYAQLLRALIACRPAAVDVEFAHPSAPQLLGEAHAAGVCTVLSEHNWQSTPRVSEMITRVEQMQELARRQQALQTTVAKFAMTPHSRDDTLDVLAALTAADEVLEIPVIGIAMGRLGRVTRLIGCEFGSAATFASVDRQSAPGQVSVAQMRAVREVLETR